MATETVTGDAVITFPVGGDIYADAFNEILSTGEFQNTITYYHYDIDYDNISGDIDRDSYDTYTIYGVVQPVDMYDKSVKFSMLEVGDCELFLPNVVTIETDGTAISFSPQIFDEFTWNGIRFKLDKKSPEYIGDSLIHTSWLCKKIDE